MVTKTATKAAKAPAKATKKAPAKAPAEETKPRGRQRDTAEEARILKALLPNVTINGEGVHARVTGIGEAAAGIELDSGKALDTTRAKMILLRHLAEKAGHTVKPTPQNVERLREEKLLSWAQIDAMTGTPRSKTLALYDEAKGEEGAWRNFHLVARDGMEGNRPKATPSASSNGSAPIEGDPVFEGDETKDVIAKKIEGKNIRWNGSGKNADVSFKAKVVSLTKVGKKGDSRVIQFNDGDKTRTVDLMSILKVGGR